MDDQYDKRMPKIDIGTIKWDFESFSKKRRFADKNPKRRSGANHGMNFFLKFSFKAITRSSKKKKIVCSYFI